MPRGQPNQQGASLVEGVDAPITCEALSRRPGLRNCHHLRPGRLQCTSLLTEYLTSETLRHKRVQLILPSRSPHETSPNRILKTTATALHRWRKVNSTSIHSTGSPPHGSLRLAPHQLKLQAPCIGVQRQNHLECSNCHILPQWHGHVFVPVPVGSNFIFIFRSGFGRNGKPPVRKDRNRS